MPRKLIILLAMNAAWAAALAHGQEGPKQSFEVSTTQDVDFMPGGTIRLEHSYGYVTVEGWDEPLVRIMVTKSTDSFYQPDHKPQATARLDHVQVSTEKGSAQELAVSTVPKRGKLLIVSWPFPKKRGVTAEYHVLVPRASRVIIHHDNGYVWVSDVAGDIQVDSHTGDMIVALPDPGLYAIDARTRLGSISSDFAGTGHKGFPLGSHFAYAAAAPQKRVRLRMGRGSISILNGPAPGPYWKN